MIDSPIVQSFKLAKNSEQTKKQNVDILHGINLCTYDIWHFFYLSDRWKKSHLKRVLRAWELQISDF